MTDTLNLDQFWLIKVVWNDGNENTMVVDEQDLGGRSWRAWIADFLVKAQRPHWAQLGDLTFYTQNVRSIDLVETIEKED